MNSDTLSSLTPNTALKQIWVSLLGKWLDLAEIAR
jgi:hypothetical protein